MLANLFLCDIFLVYDMNAMILMSCLVFVDLEECVQRLEDLTYASMPPPTVPEQSRVHYIQFFIWHKKSFVKFLLQFLEVKKNVQPKVRYGEYLQKCYIPCYSNHSNKKPKPRCRPLGYKVRLRSEEVNSMYYIFTLICNLYIVSVCVLINKITLYITELWKTLQRSRICTFNYSYYSFLCLSF